MKKNLTVVVLVLEIASIVVLHAVKLNQTEKPPMAIRKETDRATPAQSYTKLRSYISLASLK